MKNLTKTIIPTVLVILGTLNAPQAFSDNAKLYPGSMCVPWNSNQPIPQLSYGEIDNPSSTKWLGVDCPIIKDHRSGYIGRGYVSMFDRNYNKDISCALVSIHRSGTGFTGWWNQRKSSIGSKAQAQIIRYGRQNSVGVDHYFYGCSIPPKYNGNMSGISSYQAIEN